MGTIIPRKERVGPQNTTRKGTIVHRESRTFARKQAAAAWFEKRETELAKPRALEREKTPGPTLASVIDRYTEESVLRHWSNEDAGATCDQTLRYREPAVFDHYERRHHCVRQSCLVAQRTTLPGLGSRVRITSPAPNCLSKIKCLEWSVGAVFCFPAPDTRSGETEEKYQNAQSNGLSAGFGMGSVPKPRFPVRATGRNRGRRAPLLRGLGSAPCFSGPRTRRRSRPHLRRAHGPRPSRT
jgi:hypothetical protein